MPLPSQRFIEACERIAVEDGNLSVRPLHEELGRADPGSWASPCGSESAPGPSILPEAHPRGAFSERGKSWPCRCEPWP